MALENLYFEQGSRNQSGADQQGYIKGFPLMGAAMKGGEKMASEKSNAPELGTPGQQFQINSRVEILAKAKEVREVTDVSELAALVASQKWIVVLAIPGGAETLWVLIRIED